MYKSMETRQEQNILGHTTLLQNIVEEKDKEDYTTFVAHHLFATYVV